MATILFWIMQILASHFPLRFTMKLFRVALSKKEIQVILYQQYALKFHTRRRNVLKNIMKVNMLQVKAFSKKY